MAALQTGPYGVTMQWAIRSTAILAALQSNAEQSVGHFVCTHFGGSQCSLASGLLINLQGPQCQVGWLNGLSRE